MIKKFPVVIESNRMTNLKPLAATLGTGFASPISSTIPNSMWLKEGESLHDLKFQLNELKIAPAPSAQVLTTLRSLEERLFDATAEAKILTAQVAMHLEREWRDKLFKQLDSLHDAEEWIQEDGPLRKESFKTFLKAIFQLKPQRRPGLGLSQIGNLVTSWAVNLDHLTIEFLPRDRVRWVLSRQTGNGTERIAGDTAVANLASTLSHFQPEKWFSYALKRDEPS